MYYLRQQTRISGPFTAEQLRSLLHRGRAARSDKISTDRQEWIQLSDCPDIIQRPVVVSERAAEDKPAQSVVAADGFEWYFTQGGATQPSSVGNQAIVAMLAAGTLTGDDMVWREGFDDWRPISTVAEFAAASSAAPPAVPGMPPVGAGLPPMPLPPPADSGGPDFAGFVGKKMSAGLAALLIGPLGIHKFILGLRTGGVVMLLLCFLLIPIPLLSIVSFIEGILYLTKSDDAFYRDYAVNKKQWF